MPILTIKECDELLARIERNEETLIKRTSPAGSTSDILIPIEIAHELLMLWKYHRQK